MLRMALAGIGLLALWGCTTPYRKSIGVDNTQPINRIFLTDFNVAWQSVLDSLKASPLDVSNREGGFLQTKWTDNTTERNFVDSFGNADTYLKAQYRFRVTVGKGFYNGRPSVRIQVQKEQLVERDVLEGWRKVDTDLIDENTLMYRIGRLIFMKMKLALLEEEKANRSEVAPPPPGGEPPPPPADPGATDELPLDEGFTPEPEAPKKRAPLVPDLPSQESQELDILDR
ncbi:MAG TPA: hypothetical protein VM598_13655 [Bdellovibrionota bacterium]|nr:hypothetical protein [Bdellovibrionota bacterium]